MLPPPTLGLTIPSIHDDTVLDCRIYIPISYTPVANNGPSGNHRKKAAIVAHPYGPMGGSYDDPIVGLLAASMLREDFVIGTFNFRGSGGSQGRTTWTARGEVDDYVSMVGFMIYFMHDLCRTPHQSSTHEEPIREKARLPSSTRQESSIEIRKSELFDESARTAGVLLLLSGYSYGAMITTLLPSTTTILKTFATPGRGTAASEIRLRATQLAHRQNDIYTSMARVLAVQAGSSGHTRGRSLQAEMMGSQRKVSAGGIRVGGEESNPEVRRRSHETQRRRSSDRGESIRRGVERVLSGARHSKRGESSIDAKLDRHASDTSSTDSLKARKVSATSLNTSTAVSDAEEMMPDVHMSNITTAYLLVSPLQGLTFNLATMWTTSSGMKSKAEAVSEQEAKLSLNPTFAIYGDSDVFTTSRKLTSWSERLRNVDSSRFSSRQIIGAGHFWHEDGVAYEMRDFVKQFVESL